MKRLPAGQVRLIRPLVGGSVSGFQAFCARHKTFPRLVRENVWRTKAREAVNVSDLARVLPWSQDEAELVTELQGGSGAAFDWLVTHYSGSVYSLVAGMVSESCDAADITQDVFLKCVSRGFGVSGGAVR